MSKAGRIAIDSVVHRGRGLALKCLFPALVAAGLFGCSPTSPDTGSSAEVVSLAPGNEFVYHHSALWGSDSGAFADSYSKDRVTGTVILDSRKWYQFEGGICRRADGGRLYRLQGDSVSVELDYTLSPGDRVTFDGVRVGVEKISEEPVFGVLQRVFVLSANDSSSGTVTTVTYATGFGLIGTTTRMRNGTSGTTLAAALVGGKEYGNASLLTDSRP